MPLCMEINVILFVKNSIKRTNSEYPCSQISKNIYFVSSRQTLVNKLMKAFSVNSVIYKKDTKTTLLHLSMI